MADYTKSRGQLMDWTLLDDTAAVPSLESSELALDDDILALLHIDVCHADAVDATTNNVELVVWIKSGTTDDDWHEFVRVQATAGQANGQVLAAASGASQPNPDRIEVASTTNFENPGDVYFLKDVGTLANSCIVVNKDFVNDDYIQCIDDLLLDYDTSDYVYDIVNQWNFELPASTAAVRVTFHNPDGTANYACRIRWTKVTDIE